MKNLKFGPTSLKRMACLPLPCFVVVLAIERTWCCLFIGLGNCNYTLLYVLGLGLRTMMMMNDRHGVIGLWMEC